MKISSKATVSGDTLAAPKGTCAPGGTLPIPYHFINQWLGFI